MFVQHLYQTATGLRDEVVSMSVERAGGGNVGKKGGEAETCK